MSRGVEDLLSHDIYYELDHHDYPFLSDNESSLEIRNQ